MLYRFIAFFLLLLPTLAFAQVYHYADSAQSRIVFPHFVNGGPAADHWQTSLQFINPTGNETTLEVAFRDDNGLPLTVEMDGLKGASFSMVIPGLGSTSFTATNIPEQTQSGYITASSIVPIQAIATFKRVQNGKVVAAVTAEPAKPTQAYAQPANGDLGIALVNATALNAGVKVTVYNTAGQPLGESTVSLRGSEHKAFNLSGLIANLPSNFKGLVRVTSALPTERFYAWALYDDGSRVNTALPPGGAPEVAVGDQLAQKVFGAVALSARYSSLVQVRNVSLRIIEDTKVIDAYSTSNTEICITRPMLELMGNSEDELAQIFAHQFAHIARRLVGRAIVEQDPELDADKVGSFYAVIAGYNPYAVPAVLGRHAMILGQQGFLEANQQTFDNLPLSEARTLINQRVSKAYDSATGWCSLATLCPSVKNANRPSLPSPLPLNRGGSAQLNGTSSFGVQ